MRTILILLLIVLRPILLAVLWPLAAFVRFITFASPIALFFLVVILLHTSDPAQRSLAWTMIATMAGFALVSAGLTALQRELRQDPAHWFRGRAAMSQPFGSWQGRHVGARSVTARGGGSHPRSLPHLRQR
ncbi:MAG TPA: hypothetical protein VME47_21445 [Acetobacteraceae bacterium]|nr:hypothetical protein [Acetobacteraceae bacterium]